MGGRRRPGVGASGDALELFLDTICNAFGGIIFISLLVCVMLQLSGKFSVAAEEDPVEQARLQEELKALQKESDTVLAVLETQRKQQAALKTKVDPERYRKYLKLIEKERELRGENLELSKELASLRIDLAAQRKAHWRLTEDRNELVDEREELRKKLEELKKRRGVTLSVPTKGETKKNQVPLLITGGHLTFVQEYDASGKAIANNTEDVTITRTPPTVRPKAGRGIVIEVDGGASATREQRNEAVESLGRKLAASFAKFTNKPTATNGKKEEDCHYFVIAVWPDSHLQFEVLRDLLIRRGFDYSLLLMKAGEAVSAGGGKKTRL